MFALFFFLSPRKRFTASFYMLAKSRVREGGGYIFAVQRRFNVFPYVNGPPSNVALWFGKHKNSYEIIAFIWYLYIGSAICIYMCISNSPATNAFTN